MQLRNRHGSLWKRTIPAATLQPYRQAARQFVKVHRANLFVSAALSGLQSTMDGAGSVGQPSTIRSRYASPREKARASLGRLREANVPAERLLCAYLAVAGAIAEDPIGPGGEPGEYRRVQAAKAVFRLASGYHSVYGPGPNQRFDRYPRSSGSVLQYLGMMLDECCDHVREQHLVAILRVKAGDRGSLRLTRLPKTTIQEEPPTVSAEPIDLAVLFP